MKRLYEFFSSTGLTVVLSVLIAAVAGTGSFFVMANPEFYRELDSMILLPWLVSEGTRYIGLTFWIYILIALVGLFAINTFVCTFDRLYSIIKMKRPWRSFLPQLAHAGFLVALLGHFTGSVSGFRSYGNVIVKGETAAIQAAEGISIRLNNTEVKNDKTGRPDFLKTSITVFEDGEEKKSGDAMMNSPLFYKGMAFYHADNGDTITGLRLAVEGGEIEAEFGKAFASSVSGGGKKFILGNVYPDFALDDEGSPYSASSSYNNPYVEILSGIGERGFLSLRGQGATLKVGGTVITLNGFVTSPYVVVSVNKDPGIWFIGIGSAMLVLGMALLLFSREDKGELMRAGKEA
ncbi:MAG TPA: cytochrome c biogenesis protein ResB, partial [Thermodesulfobacteriota bacterium]|nr:cytochrome c biogenesis protein ResB [Thermodesulfobacteriota bacterium]